MLAEGTAAQASDSLAILRQNLSTVIRGRPESLDLLMIALLANGSVLMEGTPSEIVDDVEVRRVYLGEKFSL